MKFSVLAALFTTGFAVKLDRDFNEYIDSEYVPGPKFPNDPHATKAIADEKERMHYRNVPSIY